MPIGCRSNGRACVGLIGHLWTSLPLSNGEFPFQIINPGGLCDRPDPDAEGQSHCRDHRNPRA
jgi:hypothetical protein